MKTRKQEIDNNCQTIRKEMTKFYCMMWCDTCAHMEEIVWAIKWFLQIECMFTSDECDRTINSRKAMLPRNRMRSTVFWRKQTKNGRNM